ncbi:MAG: fumarate hydratase C-terminal domain-containing protein [Verrucomicrobiae bacterium]|nr:fumarate hydratase C-terminal domain-containing protein [Verrucomicrobiae bacterium]
MSGIIQLTTPLSEESIRCLRVGDRVTISGSVFTARDAVHKRLAGENSLPAGVNFEGAAIYHCGPVVVQNSSGQWQILAAGPTTSARAELYLPDMIRKFGLRAVIGKGGMGTKSLHAMKTHGCVYLHAVGGAAQVLAECITAVEGVWFIDEFGAPEAMWKLLVANLPAVVTMDAHGNSLHECVRSASMAELTKLFQDPGLKG